MRGALAAAGIALHTAKDHVVFERSEVLTRSGTPYTVFTPYRNAWLKKLEPFFVQAYPVERHAAALAAPPAGVDGVLPSLQPLGFERTNLHELRLPTGTSGAQALLADFLPRIADYGDDARLSGDQGAELPVGASALRHRVDPRSSRAAARAAIERR